MSGEITWQQNKKKRTIDYIITNTDMHRRFVAMHIDEDRDEFVRSQSTYSRVQ